MQRDSGHGILRCLQTVSQQRALRAASASLGLNVDAVKRFQHARFAQTYADLLAESTREPAARFFLDDLYGPRDFSERDEQFARIVPALVRLFPNEIVRTVGTLAHLHALTETLDTRMGEVAEDGVVDDQTYGTAWRAVGSPDERSRQLALMMDVGSALVRYTKRPVLRHSLRLMRTPARAAGLASLQQFLERGFDTFRILPEPEAFLELIALRERQYAATLFAGSSA